MMSNSEKEQKIIERVKALLAMAEHANSDPNEIIIAARRARSLIDKHGISELDLIDDKSKYNLEEFNKVNSDSKWGKFPAWVSCLPTTIAKYYDCSCKIILTQNYHEKKGRMVTQRYIRFYGFGADPEIAKYVLDHYLNRIIAQYNYEKGNRKFTRTEGDNYKTGLSCGIIDYLREEIKIRKSNFDSESTTSNSKGLIILNAKQQGLIDHDVELVERTIQLNIDESGYRKGRDMAINHGVQSSEEKLKLG